ncbi:spindle assembly checkpoint component Mad1 [Limtongia smithiae]|uniref:spindle assembly checkpoint component Mad1 n=1 Tax=Limtongia smithiae TaxID=1125753 RepID=UPI0034CEA7B9
MRKSIATPSHEQRQGPALLVSTSKTASALPVRKTGLFTPSTSGIPTRPVSRTLFQKNGIQNSTLTEAETNAALVEQLRTQSHALKYELSALKDERERDRLRFEKTIRELENQIKEDGKRADAIENEENFLFEKHKQASEELDALKAKYTAEKSALERDLRITKRDAADAAEQRDEARSALRTATAAASRHAEEYASKMHLSHTTIKELQTQLTTVSAQHGSQLVEVNALNDKIEALETEVKELRAKADDLALLEGMRNRLEEREDEAKALRLELDIITPELTGLREEHKKFKFVAEEKTLLEARLRLMEDLRRQAAEAEYEAATLRDEQASWRAVLETAATNGDNFRSPEDVVHMLAKERTEKLALLDKVGRLEAELSAQTKGLEEDASSAREQNAQHQVLEANLARAEKRLVVAERQRALALKESEFLKEQIKIYDTQEATFSQIVYDDHSARRIDDLEKLLAASKEEIAKLTSVLKTAPEYASIAESTEARKKRAADNAAEDARYSDVLRRYRDLQNAYTSLQATADAARKDVAILSKRLKTTEHASEAKVRVLELRDNPISRDQAVKKSMLDALSSENQALIAQLEGRKEDIGPVVSAHTLERMKLEMKEMQALVADKEKRMTRLKEIWSAKSVEFREAVYSLLGYKLDFLPSSKVRATSMFASSDEESFIFDPTAGTMKLSGRTDSAFATECANLVTFWVQERREIPCFLAALNLELYDKTTKAARF